MRRFLLPLVLLALTLTACIQPVPPGPTPQPPPIPVPVPPGPTPNPTPTPVPEPVDVGVVLTWEQVQKVMPGMTRAELVAAVGREPLTPPGDKDQRDGTFLLRFPAVNSAGTPKWMDVQTEGGVVIGRALWPR